MSSAWTGGQYSVFRILFGAFLAVHFAALVPYAGELFSSAGALPDASTSPLSRLFPNLLTFIDAPGFVTAFVGAAALASLCLAAGWRDRVAAVFVWYVLACTFGRNPLISNPSLPYVGLLLIVHALLPRAPWGSWEARGRTDPGGGWQMRSDLFTVVWTLMAVGYTYSGITKLVSPSWRDGTAASRVLENPLARPHFVNEWMLALPAGLLQALTFGALALELLFVPLALFGRTRPWIWAAMLLMHLSLLVTIDFADLTCGMIALHLFTFDPSWLRPKHAAEVETVFYDGSCGLCHGAVRWILAEDRDAHFRFAPLEGETFAATGIASQGLPDSLVVHTSQGDVLVRSSAVVHILFGLGGVWRVAGYALRILPRPLRDLGYDLVARVRYRIFGKKTDACPMLPVDLRERFTF